MFTWFISYRDEISGPFTTEEVRSNAKSGLFDRSSFIWGKPQSEWKPIEWWLSEVESSGYGYKPVKETQMWHYAQSGASHGPFVWSELIPKLEAIKDRSEVLLWTKGQKNWIPLFESLEVCRALGVDRRQMTRANIAGHVVIRHNDQIIIGKLCTISQGGFGATQIEGVEQGQVVDVYIKSDKFYEEIHAKAEVRYMGPSGFVGFQFENLHMEAKSAIVDFIRSLERRKIA